MPVKTPVTEENTSDSALGFFRDRFGLGNDSLEETLDTALERQVDYADVYIEYTTRESFSLEEGIVKETSHHVEQGVGVRAQSGERQGYAHSDEISLDSAKLAAGAARAISETSSDNKRALVTSSGAHDLYPIEIAPNDIAIGQKVDLLGEIDRYARGLDPSVQQVMASLITEHRRILIAGSDGSFAADVQPLVRLNVQVIAADGQKREVGYDGGGGRYAVDKLLEASTWQPMADEAVRIARLNLESRPCPAGSMTVVLGPGWPGILLHEAIGHGLEGDFNRKKTSAFSDQLGKRVAAEGVTVVDDGTLPHRRGSINVDDEGTPSQRNVLIEDGILVGYLHDKLNARLMGMEPTGNGRRESYAHMPLPRMTNTFMLAGQDDPSEIIGSVSKGLYAVCFGGGQVDITSGKFVFSASEAYLIEDGHLGAPVKGATLIGNGPDVLTRVTRIGNDLEIDRGVGTCGKDGQGVPVGVGLPTLRIEELTVGGTEG